MTNWQPENLQGDPATEEAIRQYYIKKKLKERDKNSIFQDGAATKVIPRVKFSIDNSYLHEVTDEQRELYNRNNSKALEKHYRSVKALKRYKEQQECD